MRKLLLVGFLLFSIVCLGQKKDSMRISPIYYDSLGNSITIYKYAYNDIPKIFDTLFLKKELAPRLTTLINDSMWTGRYIYVLHEVKKTRRNVYDFRIYWEEKRKSLYDTVVIGDIKMVALREGYGINHYYVRVKKAKKGVYKIESIYGGIGEI